MVEVKDAAKLAIQYIQSLSQSNEVYHFRVEEVELLENEENMILTLSYDAKDGIFINREYKQFTIRLSDGKVLSMKIRKA